MNRTMLELKLEHEYKYLKLVEEYESNHVGIEICRLYVLH